MIARVRRKSIPDTSSGVSGGSEMVDILGVSVRSKGYKANRMEGVLGYDVAARST